MCSSSTSMSTAVPKLSLRYPYDQLIAEAAISPNAASVVENTPSRDRLLAVFKVSIMKREITSIELTETADFIENNSALIALLKGKGGGFILRDPKIRLHKTIFVNSTGDILINCKKHTLGSQGIGYGAFKTVTLAIHYQSGRIFAYAVTKMGLSIDDTLNERHQLAIREHKFGMILKKSPNVVNYSTIVYFWNKMDFKQGIYMPYYRGGDMFHQVHGLGSGELKNVEWDRVQLSYLVKGILRGLAAIHEKGVIHLDIKMENVFLNAVDLLGKRILKPYIGDFGLALEKEKVTHESICRGSFPYMAPEVFEYIKDPTKGLGSISEAVDVYATGLIFGDLLFQIQPILCENTKRSTPIYVSMPEPSNKGTFEHLIWRMTRDNPKERPTSQEAYELSIPALSEYRSRFVKRTEPQDAQLMYASCPVFKRPRLT